MRFDPETIWHGIGATLTVVVAALILGGMTTCVQRNAEFEHE